MRTSCVTVFYFFTLFGHARTLLRYRLLLFHTFRAREHPLALPFSAFSPFSGTRGPSCVTIFYFFTLFGHARTLLRYRFLLFHPFRAREDPLALPFSTFTHFSGTLGPSCVTVYPFIQWIWARNNQSIPIIFLAVFTPFSIQSGIPTP
jgi:hypothetical protein